MLFRILTKDDVHEEYRDIVTKIVFCPILKRNQVALFCFACSRLTTCETSKKVGVADLELEDIVRDAKFFKKQTYARRIELGGEPKLKKNKKSVAKTPRKGETSKDKLKNSVQEVKSMRGEKKKAILKYLETNPSASASEIRKACNVSAMYAKKVLAFFNSQNAASDGGDVANPPQD